ncbi:MAG: hypothetical protein IPF54_22960 [Draconibacterium sp.]|nr:hypothetical protein [Draconibacterium sp.]
MKKLSFTFSILVIFTAINSLSAQRGYFDAPINVMKQIRQVFQMALLQQKNPMLRLICNQKHQSKFVSI